ncbi:glutathione gamma-glutamylcysteinyltransferase 1 [Canna indica]|uniref:glutathione gamma-glutamylcysteinyltransferase n=1 Tax=Canna indica TaxID=4628 RepID=A0AAQ3KC15_9LILI|nr:glutathione gamma-glutamylcysteinyltransferase 1 [Canna indica]
MEGFFKLISHFQTQSEPAYCGLASLSMVLNALAIDPRRKWKGPWRWYDESMLDCCEPLEKVKAEGITFGKVVCLAQCAGAKVEAFRTNQSNIDDFRHRLIKCTSLGDCHLIASYHRKPFKQTGTGHFSPIGGYHAQSDMVLILDVARFKYPPHWVPLALLWQAMDTIDQATECPRGFMLISSHQKAPSLLYTLSCRDEGWLSIAKYLIDDVPMLLKSEDPKSVSQVLSLILKCLPASAGDFIKWVAEVRRQEEGGSTLTEEEKERLTLKEEILEQVRKTELFKYVTNILYLSTTNCNIGEKCSLPEIAANVCCQGAALLSEGLTPRTGIGCRGSCVTCLKADGDKPMTIVSGTVVSHGNKQDVDMLVPVSSATSWSSCCSTLDGCIVMHPASNDVLTVLLLALPASTWLAFEDENLRAEMQRLASNDNLPIALQEEVLHLRCQLHCLKRCKDKELDDDLNLPARVGVVV